MTRQIPHPMIRNYRDDKYPCVTKLLDHNFAGLVQECSISRGNALEILQSCTKPSISWLNKSCLFFQEPWNPNGTAPILVKHRYVVNAMLSMDTDWLLVHKELQNMEFHQGLEDTSVSSYFKAFYTSLFNPNKPLWLAIYWVICND